MEAPSQFWQWLTALDLLGIAAGLIVLTTLFEKAFNVEFIGRRLFRMAWGSIRFFVNWFLMPFRPQINTAKTILTGNNTLHAKVDKIIEQGDARDQRRSSEFAELTQSVEIIKGEMVVNGGKSIKDSVNRLLRHDVEKWATIQTVREALDVINLRQDIADEADRRMTFKLSPQGECTYICAAFLRFFGYTDEDVLATDLEFCISPKSIGEVRERWGRAMEKRIHYRNNQFLLDSDGKEYYCCVKIYPVKRDEEFKGFFGTVDLIEPEAVVT
jgi:PAS domain S-box-containing protein